MKHFLLLLPWFLLPAVAGNRPPQVASISLYTQFQEEPAAAVVQTLHDELASIMAPMGLTFAWRPLSPTSGRDVSVELAVLTFRGRCDAGGLVSHRTDAGPLGWTHVSDGIILPFSDVDCDRIHVFLQKELLLLPQRDRDAAFGRAIARVVAHELYHILANTARHGAWGVGKAAYTVQELLSDDFQFEARETRALRESKAFAALEDAGRTDI